MQDDGERILAGGLRAVIGGLGKIGDRSRRHLAVAVEVEGALDLVAHLIEIMVVARREEIAVGPHHLEMEVLRRSGLALEQAAALELPLTRPVLDVLERGVFQADDLHGDLL